jgi:PncC family amidohydrolase
MKRKVNQLVKYLKENELTIALAESMTCGLASHQLSTVKGTSEVLKGSIVCYDEEVKTSLCRVKPSLVKRYTAESQEVTDALAKNLCHCFEADVYAAITGLAAPGASESKAKPVGTVFFSVVYKNELHCLKKVFKGTPLEIKKKACRALYEFAYSVLEKANKE